MEADEELRECEGYEIPSSIVLERWQAEIQDLSDLDAVCFADRIEFLGEPI